MAHPVMPIRTMDGEALASLKAKVDPLLARDMASLVDLVPRKNGISDCGCPNCDQGSRDNQIVWNGIGDPHSGHCRFCNHRYPSDEYSMDHILNVPNRRGEQEQWRYYEGTGGKRHFFAARVRYWRKWYLARLTQDIADLYAATGDDRYADAAAELLYRLSQRHAGWVVANRHSPLPDAAPPYPKGGSIWHHWHYRDMEPSVAYAYDRLYESGALERLGQREGVDVKRAIEQDMLYPSVAFARSFEERWDNASPALYRGLVLYGRILSEPDFVHDGINRAASLLRKKYLFDGMWRETTVSYHLMTTSSMRKTFELARGYTDAPGYVHPQTGKRFDDFDAVRDIPFLQKAVNVADALVFPNGRIVPVNDAWARTVLTPPECNGPVLLPAMGHVRLARRTDRNAIQAHLHFGPSYGHRNYDSLSLILWAKSRELLSDIGYSHTAWRMWTIRTASHNTVMVDGWDQVSQPASNLQLYAPLSENLQVVEAESRAAYPGTVTDYRRRLVLVGVSEVDAYVVDIFRVAGGRQHDWILHGSANHDQTATLSLPLAPLAGTMLGSGAQFRLPRTEHDTGEFSGPGIDSHPAGGKRWYRLRGVGYAFMQRVGKAQTDEAWSVAFDPADDSDTHLRTTVLGQPDTTVYQISSPSIRRANENDAELSKYSMPGVLVRRRADAGLTSVFAAVHGPWRKKRFVTSVRSLLPTAPGDQSAPVALEVTHTEGVDYVLCTPAGTEATMEVQLPDGPLRCDGTMGFLRVQNGRVAAAGVLDGTMLTYGDLALTVPYPTIAGRITGVEVDEARGRYAFAVDRELPPAQALVGRCVVVTHGDGRTHGYEISGADRAGQKNLLYLAADPGFRLKTDGQTQFVYFPQASIAGGNSFRISSMATHKLGR
ncbi:MAG: hypothetical protein HN406_34255 [Lentisphaerae bacterium]|nr:hypothetical protein [Lentisphaerota bacterium]